MVLQYKYKCDRIHDERGRKNLQETQEECACICDGGRVSQIRGHDIQFHWQACQIVTKQQN